MAWILLNKSDAKFLNKISLRFGFEKEGRHFTQPMTSNFFKGLARHFQEKQLFSDERLHRKKCHVERRSLDLFEVYFHKKEEVRMVKGKEKSNLKFNKDVACLHNV